jgi:hypothetical protein
LDISLLKREDAVTLLFLLKNHYFFSNATQRNPLQPSSVTLGDFYKITPFQLTKNQGFTPV